MRNPTYVVLGASGFIGKHLCARLSAKGFRVRAFSRTPAPESRFAALPNVRWFHGDFLDKDDLSAALRGCDLVYHLISSTTPGNSNRSPLRDAEENIVGTVRLLDLMRNEGIPKIVFVSTGGAIYGDVFETPIPETAPTNPITAYGIGKVAIEKYLALYERTTGMSYCVLRVANAYGTHQPVHRAQGAIGVFLAKAIRGESIEIWGDGSIVRDYVCVDDVTRALQFAAAYSGDQRVFNIGSGLGLSLNEVLEYMEAELGFRIPRRYCAARAADVPVSVLDVALARDFLKWKPQIPFKIGLRKVVFWMRQENMIASPIRGTLAA